MRIFVFWLHLVAAISWIGGMIFLSAVVTPYARKLPPALRGEVFREVGVRFRNLGWVTIAILIVTGFGNVSLIGMSWSDLPGTRVGNILIIKLFLVALMLINSIFHDFVFGPKMTTMQKAGQRPAPWLSWASSWMARLNLVLALVVVWLGAMLTR